MAEQVRVSAVSSLTITGLLTACAVWALSGHVAYVVVTPSMEPTYPVGSLVLADETDAATLREGDVLLFKAPTPRQPTYLHRIHAIDDVDGQRVLRTKGDANETADPWRMALTSDVAWTPKYTVPHVGHIIATAKRPPVRAASTAVVGASVLWVALRSIWRPRPDEDSGDPEDGEEGPDG